MEATANSTGRKLLTGFENLGKCGRIACRKVEKDNV
jgi:hypothetical protein